MKDNKRQGGLLNMAAFLPKSCSNGPGLRAVIWVQGCPRRCPGCFNQDMLEFQENQLISVGEMAAAILAIDSIEGVTFSGGEPFAQAQALAELAERLGEYGLNIVSFTGYTFTELTGATDPGQRRLLAATDLLIAGPYSKELPSKNYLLGSTNQEIVFLTDKLKQHPDVINRRGQTMEVIIDAAGNVIVTGLEGHL